MANEKHGDQKMGASHVSLIVYTGSRQESVGFGPTYRVVIWLNEAVMALTRHLIRLPVLVSLLLCAATSGVYANSPDPPIELIVLGSGGPGATGRASSSYIVLIDGIARIIVDAGSGSFTRLGESKVSLASTETVLLTHLHVDHAGELPGFFKARAVSSSGPIAFKVWGPQGSRAHEGAYFPSTSEFIRLLFGPKGAFAYLRDFSAPLSIEAHDVSSRIHANDTPQVIFQQSPLAITAIAGHHGEAPAVIYRIDYRGASVTFSGDIDAEGAANLGRIAKDSDLLVFNNAVLDPPQSPAILYTLHTPPGAIGELAKNAHVRRLLLSHLSPATDEMHEEVLKSIRRSFIGVVSVAEDGMRVH
jgi:ribonuclease BN (tRNA processing enzyme)